VLIAIRFKRFSQLKMKYTTIKTLLKDSASFSYCAYVLCILGLVQDIQVS